MQHPRQWLLCLSPLILVSVAQGQAFNIDVGPNLVLWPAPSSSYAAAAGQTGIWNEVRNPFLGDTLLSVSGVTSQVVLTSDVTSSFSYPFGNLGADDDAFTSDGQAISYFGPPATWDFSGLMDGHYTLYTYCWDPANSGVQSEVTISGDPSSTQSVGGFWSGSPHVLGVTYAQHSLDVSGGSFGVEVFGHTQGDSATVLGFQLVPGGSSGAMFCFGDGTGISCPCGNMGAAGEGCMNSSGRGALLALAGSTSTGSDDLLMSMTGGPATSVALLFAGTNQVNGGNGQLFGDGFLCAGGQIQRLGAQQTSGGTAAWGPGIGAGGNWMAGDTRHFQIWYRDMNGSPCGGSFNTSQAASVTFTP